MAIDHPGGRRVRSTSAPSSSGSRSTSTRKPLRSTRSPTRSRTCSAGSSWTSARSTSTSIAASSCSTRRTAPRRQPAARSTAAAPTRPTRRRSAPTPSAPRTRQPNATSLGFKPKLHTRLSGPTKRAKNPRIRAILEAREGDANLGRAALTLPHSLFLDQSHIETVCTRPQLAAQTCPKDSIYGHAEAVTPLLEQQAEGPGLPGVLRATTAGPGRRPAGQVNIQLHGVISSKHGGLKTVFNSVPDVPVKKFILNMQGGKKSLLSTRPTPARASSRPSSTSRARTASRSRTTSSG